MTAAKSGRKMKMGIVIVLAKARRDGVDRAKIKELMKAKGITCAKAAAFCGKSRAAIKSKLEGLAAFSVGDMLNFYRLLGLGAPNAPSASEIFFRDPANPLRKF